MMRPSPSHHQPVAETSRTAVSPACPRRAQREGLSGNSSAGLSRYREIGTIVPRVVEATDVTEVQRIVHEEFVRWFHVDIAGPLTQYETMAREIWEAASSFRGAR